MNNYRVDRNKSSVIVPCGMASIIYIGDNWAEARKVFDGALTGRDSWGNPNECYGLTLSVWSDTKRNYIVKATRNINEA